MKFKTNFLTMPLGVKLKTIEDSKEGVLNRFVTYLSKALTIPEDSLIGTARDSSKLVRFVISGQDLEIRILDTTHPDISIALFELKEFVADVNDIIQQYVADYNLDKELPNSILKKLSAIDDVQLHGFLKSLTMSNRLETVRAAVTDIQKQTRIKVPEELLIEFAEWYNGGKRLEYQRPTINK